MVPSALFRGLFTTIDVFSRTCVFLRIDRKPQYAARPVSSLEVHIHEMEKRLSKPICTRNGLSVTFKDMGSSILPPVLPCFCPRKTQKVFSKREREEREVEKLFQARRAQMFFVSQTIHLQRFFQTVRKSATVKLLIIAPKAERQICVE